MDAKESAERKGRIEVSQKKLTVGQVRQIKAHRAAMAKAYPKSYIDVATLTKAEKCTTYAELDALQKAFVQKHVKRKGESK